MTRETMHLVLRSSRAKGTYSFRTPQNQRRISTIVEKFSARYGVRIISLANVGNHLHFHIKIANRFTYVRFIRAMTSGVAMAISGRSRWNPNAWVGKFWDYRPFTRALKSYQEYLNLNDYIQINTWEGQSVARASAIYLIQKIRGVQNEVATVRRLKFVSS